MGGEEKKGQIKKGAHVVLARVSRVGGKSESPPLDFLPMSRLVDDAPQKDAVSSSALAARALAVPAHPGLAALAPADLLRARVVGGAWRGHIGAGRW